MSDELIWLSRMLDVVRERKGLDFSSYRSATMLRRVQNRMIAASARTLPEYYERLRATPGEADALVERLTIKVSRFFRDPPAFVALREALARRRAERGGRRLAVWSAGCGQGEEPYSLSILLEDIGQAPGAGDILATDIDASALAVARQGCYPPASIESVPAGLRAAAFDALDAPKGPRFRVRPELRAGVDFQPHDLVGGGPPAGDRRFDLICCRNVLIYLQPPVQGRVERLLASCLAPGGLLFLGEAEWLLPQVAGDFEVLDRRGRLFRRRGERQEGAA